MTSRVTSRFLLSCGWIEAEPVFPRRFRTNFYFFKDRRRRKVRSGFFFGGNFSFPFSQLSQVLIYGRRSLSPPSRSAQPLELFLLMEYGQLEPEPNEINVQERDTRGEHKNAAISNFLCVWRRMGIFII